VGLVIFTFTVRLKQAKDLFFKHFDRFDGFVEFHQFGIVQSPPVWNIDKKYNYYDKKNTAFQCSKNTIIGKKKLVFQLNIISRKPKSHQLLDQALVSGTGENLSCKSNY
jgi:hypothetical protein